MSDDLRARLLESADECERQYWCVPPDSEAEGRTTRYVLRATANRLREAASALAIRGHEHEETDDQARPVEPDADRTLSIRASTDREG